MSTKTDSLSLQLVDGEWRRVSRRLAKIVDLIWSRHTLAEWDAAPDEDVEELRTAWEAMKASAQELDPRGRRPRILPNLLAEEARLFNTVLGVISKDAC